MTEQTTKTAQQVQRELAAPFPADVVRWKPQTVSGSRALAVPYVNAAAVMDRLDEVLGVDGWEDDYERLESGAVACRLWIRVGGEWHLHADAGGQSQQKDAGDRVKAAFSAALKRAARRFGVGRYLGKVKGVWAELDPQTRQFKTPPALPAWALPKAPRVETLPPSAPTAQQAATTPAPSANGPAKPAQAPQKKQAPPAPAPGAISPEQGKALARLLVETGSDHALLFAKYAITRLGELPAVHLADATGRTSLGEFRPKPDQPKAEPRYPAPPQAPSATQSSIIGAAPSLKVVETGQQLATWLQLMNSPGAPAEARGASQVVNQIARDVGDMRPVSQWDGERVAMARASLLRMLEGRLAPAEPAGAPAGYRDPAECEPDPDPEEGRYAPEYEDWPPPEPEM